MLNWFWEMVKVGGPPFALLLAITGGLIAYGELRADVKTNTIVRIDTQKAIPQIAKEQAVQREMLNNIREDQRHMRKQLDSLVDKLIKESVRGN